MKRKNLIRLSQKPTSLECCSDKSLTVKSVLLATLSGLLLLFSFPPYGTGYLAWVALIPLYFSIQGQRPGRAFLLGWIAGMLFYAGSIYWIAYVITHYGSLSICLGIMAMLILSAYLAIYFALFSACIGYFRKGNWPLIILAPAWWVCLEYIKSHLMTGFPWENLGHSQFLHMSVIQIADITGIFGLSFLVVLVNTALFGILSGSRTHKVMLVEAGVALTLLTLTIGYGIIRIHKIEKIQHDSIPLPVSLIQGNIKQDIKWEPRYQNETLNIYESLSRSLQFSDNGLIVWPETAMPFFFQDATGKSRRVMAIAKSSNGWLLFGSPSYISNGLQHEFQNSAYLLSPDGQVRGKYSKVHLVPFGEYVPLRKIFPFLKMFAVDIGDFLPGQNYNPMMMGPFRLAVLICYEGVLSEAGTAYKNHGANLFVNITNDAWFGKTAAPYQHLSMTIFRAVENRLYIVRAANTGISAIIDATGSIISQTGLFERSRLSGTVRLMRVPTIYARWGDSIMYLCCVILATFLIQSEVKSHIESNLTHNRRLKPCGKKSVKLLGI
jgi:apolipoprotein N-acyltransferase